MLVLKLRVGESALAEGLFELHYLDCSSGLIRFKLETVERLPYTILDLRGGLASGMAYPQECPEFSFRSGGGRLRFAGCEIEFERFRESSVKLSIDADRSIRFSRPASHGTSLRRA